MKEKQAVREKTIVIDIKLTGRLVMVLSCVLVIVGLLAYLTLTGESAAASGETSPAQSSGMRQFYLTTSTHDGNEALTACARGYHFASFWELVDPSNLKYNTSLGQLEADSGQGPPTTYGGWVRTGYQPNTSDFFPGRANCAAWTSEAGDKFGTTVILTCDWTLGVHLGVWRATTTHCELPVPVWCIEN